jgi:hypothetical protein
MRQGLLLLSIIAWAVIALAPSDGAAWERRADLRVRRQDGHIIFAYRGMDYPYIGCDHRGFANCMIDVTAVGNGLKSYGGERVAIKCLIPLRDHTAGANFTYTLPFISRTLALTPDKIALKCEAPGLKSTSVIGLFIMDRDMFQRARADDQKLVLPATQVSGVILLGSVEDRTILYARSEVMHVDAYIPTGEGLDGASYAKGAMQALGYGAKLYQDLSGFGLL